MFRVIRSAALLRWSVGIVACAAVLYAWLPRRGLTRSHWNVVLITLDTTRADRLGAYGFAATTTPNLDRLAREGARFDQTESAAPLTLPAHSTLMTGRFPFEHGVLENGEPLNASERTLAQELHDSGFRTAAFVSAYVLAPRWGLARGFDTYDAVRDSGRSVRDEAGGGRRPANEVVDRALSWLPSVADSRFFVWLHFYDAHAPYDLPAGDLRAPGYQGAIEFMDAQIGRVLAFLGDHALLDRTVIVVVGDHGESLGEHGEPTHGLFIYESVSRVPLIIRTPLGQFRGRVIDDVVRTVDVSPTILELLGVSVPPSVTGVSLIPTMAATARTPGRDAHIETWYPRDHFGWSELRAVRSARYKLIAAPHPEIYDLAADPAELHNLYDHRPDLRATLAARLTAIEAGRAARRPDLPGIDADARARLATLGYVSGRRPPESGSPLADPKDNIELYRRILGKDPFPRPDHGAVRTTVKPEDQP